MTETKTAALPYTILVCAECVKLLGMDYSKQIGGTDQTEPCQLCGKMNFLHEHRTGVTMAEIKNDLR